VVRVDFLLLACRSYKQDEDQSLKATNASSILTRPRWCLATYSTWWGSIPVTILRPTRSRSVCWSGFYSE